MEHRIGFNNTNQILIEALRHLMNEVNYKKITVKMISDQCGVSTRTFYNHFKDKNDLLFVLLDEEANKFTRDFDSSITWQEAMRKLLHSIYCNIRFFKNAASYTGQNSLFDSLVLIGLSRSERFICRKDNCSTIPDDIKYVNAAFNHECYYQIIQWIKSGAKKTPDELLCLISLCVPACLQQYYE